MSANVLRFKRREERYARLFEAALGPHWWRMPPVARQRKLLRNLPALCATLREWKGGAR